MEASSYNLKASNGRHVRIATMVTFDDGRIIRFTERLSKREAIRQAKYQRRKQDQLAIDWIRRDIGNYQYIT